MKRSLTILLFAVAFLVSKAALGTTWYIRADGGTRYSANATAGQCDGQADTAYSGKGVNQHCAFNDYRFLWDDQHTYGSVKWVIQGGDTVILDNTKQWRIGFDQGRSTSDAWCFGGGGTFGCGNPDIPAGTAKQHTRILGRNYAACSAGNQPDPSKMTQIFGGYGVWTALNLTGTQYVDVECLEITSHADCIVHGSPAYPRECQRYGSVVDDYDSSGVSTDTGTSDVLLQDLWVHGHTDRGIKGPIGGLITATRVDVSTNGMAGWDLDPGDSTQSPNGVIRMSYSTIEWSGCNQSYPNTLPVSCYSQSTGGYGDGMGTPVTNMAGVYIDHSIFRYNTQDGEDFGHVILSPTLSITNSASYGNSGGQFKWAGFQNVNFANNVAVGNCLRMSQPIPGIPATYNAHLADFCRAQDALSFDFNNNANALLTNNTIVSYAPTTFDIQCYDSKSCAGTTLTMNNNLVLGYSNPSTYNMGGQVGGVGGFCIQSCNNSTLPLGKINRANNIYKGFRGSCIANQQIYSPGSVTGESCLDPQFNNEPAQFNGEASLDGFDFSLSSSSPARGGGVTVSGITTDYLDATRSNPTSIGAVEYGDKLTLNTLTSWLGGVVGPPAPVPPPAPAPTNPAPGNPAPAQPQATMIVLTIGKGSTRAYPFVITATVTPTGNTSGKVQGTVIFYTTGNVQLATATLNGSGKATYNVPSGYTGTPIFAVFQGSSMFASSTSNTINGGGNGSLVQ